MTGAAPEALLAARWLLNFDRYNQPMSETELDETLPRTSYKILKPPTSYVPLRMVSSLGVVTPVVASQMPLYSIPTEGGMRRDALGVTSAMPEALKGFDMKPEDYTNFGAVIDKNVKENDVAVAEQHHWQIMRLCADAFSILPSSCSCSILEDKERSDGCFEG